MFKMDIYAERVFDLFINIELVTRVKPLSLLGLCEEIKQTGSQPFIFIGMSLKAKDLSGASLLLLDKSKVGSTAEVLKSGPSLVVLWLRRHTPSAGAWVRSLVRELDPIFSN